VGSAFEHKKDIRQLSRMSGKRTFHLVNAAKSS
jgi:hypothetical protein